MAVKTVEISPHLRGFMLHLVNDPAQQQENFYLLKMPRMVHSRIDIYLLYRDISMTEA